MTNNKFFNFVKNNDDAELYINGDIVANDDTWLYDIFEVEHTAPKGFKEGLDALDGKPLTVYIDSYGGNVMAASSIYTMLREYKGKVTTKIDSIAASAASIIAMAGDEVLMSRTAYLMIHDPMTYIEGNITDVKQGLESLKAIKEGIINAYERKSNLSREKIAKLMTDETWLDYNTALEYGFIDGEIGAEKQIIPQAVLDSIRNQKMAVYNMVSAKNKPCETVELPTSEVSDKVDEVVDGAVAADTGIVEPVVDTVTDSEIQAMQAEYEFLKLKTRHQ